MLTPMCLAIWGWYADRYASRRVPFLLGLVAIACATVIIWLSRQIALQVVGRVLQGLACAVVWVTGLAMIADTVEEEEIGQYVGYLGFAMMSGM
jgi:MFS family permease